MGNALKLCPRCGKLISWGKSYCDECKPLAEVELVKKKELNRAAAQKNYNRNRNDKYLKFYRSKAWRATSKAKLSSVNYRCEMCGAIAVEVHHKKPIQTDECWELRLDWDNLIALCVKCHNNQHDRSGKKKQSGVIDLRELKKKLNGG